MYDRTHVCMTQTQRWRPYVCTASAVPQVRSPQYPQSAVPAVRSTRGAVRGGGPPVLRVLRLNILWYLFI